MAIDPSIIQGIRPLQLPDVSKQFADTQGLIQQRQLNNERLISERRANEMADTEAQDQIKLRTAYQTAKGDPEGTVQAAIKLGVGPKALQATQQHFADYQKKVADIKAAELPGQKYRDEKMLGLHDEAIQLATTDPQKYAATYPQLYAQAVALDPKAAEHLEPNTPPSVDQLQMSRNGYATHTYFLGQEDEKRKQQKAAEEAAKAKREADLAPYQLTEAQTKAALGTPQLAEAKAKAISAALQTTGQTVSTAGITDDKSYQAWAMKQLPEVRAALPTKYDADTIAAVQKLGMTPDQQVRADVDKGNVNEYQLELMSARGDKDAKIALANRQRDKMAAAAASRDPNIRIDREIAQYGKPFDEISKGADSQLDKILDAEKLLAGGAVGQALGIPKILTAIVSGQGSGVRITQAELDAVAKARGISGNVEGFFNKLSGKGTLTDEQKKQMQGVLDDVRERIVQKKMIARGVADEMAAAPNREAVLAAAKKGRDSLDAHAKTPPTLPATPMPATLSASDVGKIYIGAGGKKLKITAVNPSNPKQFQSEEVK